MGTGDPAEAPDGMAMIGNTVHAGDREQTSSDTGLHPAGRRQARTSPEIDFLWPPSVLGNFN